MDETKRCKAKSKQTGERCKRYVTPGMKVCKFHGGKSLRGPAHPRWKHGGTARYVPERMAQALATLRTDPKLLELTHELSVLKVLYDEALARSEEGGTAAAWTRLHDLRLEALSVRDQAQRATREAVRLESDGDATGAARERERIAALGRKQGELFGEMLEEVARGGTAQEAIDELHRNVATQVKVVDTERRRLEGAKAYARREEVAGIMARLVVCFREEIERAVVDPAERRAALSGVALRVRALISEMQEEHRVLPPATENSDAD